MLKQGKLKIESCIPEAERLALQDKMVNTIIDWSDINSGSLNSAGVHKMAETLIQAFEPLQCEKDLIHDLSIEQINDHGEKILAPLGPLLRFSKRLNAKTKILLVGHMDTVYPAEHPFQIAVLESPNILQGPGVADMKGGLCIMLNALLRFEQSPYRDLLGWEVIINPDEEVGSLASGSVIAAATQDKNLGLVFEPALDDIGTLAAGRKGSGRFVFIVHGRAAHAGRNHHEGVSAVLALAKIIQQVESLNGQRKGVTFNVGRVHGGGAVNVVPDLAVCQVDIRIQELSDEAWVVQQCEHIVQEANRQPGIEIELKQHFNRIPKKVEGKTLALYELVREIGLSLDQNIQWRESGGCSDGNNLSHAGLPNVDTLGPSGGKIHREGEYILIDSLVPRVELTTALLCHLAQFGF